MYQHILVAIDGSATSDLGLVEAIRLARLTQGQLRLLHVIDELSLRYGLTSYGGVPGDWLTLLRKAGTHLLERARATAAAAGIPAEVVLYEGLDDSLADAVAAQASAWPADVVVLGTHGRRGFERMALGSDAEKILRSATVPVLLVRAPSPAAAHGVGTVTIEP